LPVAIDGMVMRNVRVRIDAEQELGELSVALRWVIQDGPFPPTRTTGKVSQHTSDDGELTLRVSERPPAEALLANEATVRAGVAVAYVLVFVDGNGNGLLDCRNPGDCDDIQVGVSPNTLVVYAEDAWPADGEPLFGFYGQPGVRPPAGWSLVYLEPRRTRPRPTAREWTAADTVELAVIGDFLGEGAGARSYLQPDVD
jgi:hypothetical protein